MCTHTRLSLMIEHHALLYNPDTVLQCTEKHTSGNVITKNISRYIICTDASKHTSLRGSKTVHRELSHRCSQLPPLFYYVVDSSYQEGNIRLVGGDYNWEGRVEIFYSGTWSTIHDTSWTISDATVVCRQLQHSTEGCDCEHT